MTSNPSGDDRTALVTGASSGIGAEFAKQIASDGYDLVLTARREDRLEAVAHEMEDRFGVTATVIPCDLADPSGPRKLYQAVEEAGIEVHTLVNNAGFPVYGRFDETSIEQELDMVRVNVLALTELTDLFARPMIERGEGAILNLASLAGFYSIPRCAVYGATKAYVLSFTEAIAHEFRDDGVRVTALCPGPVETEFMEKGNIDRSQASDGRMADPASIAEAGWAGLNAGKPVVRPDLQAKLFSRVPRILPRKRATSMVAGLFEPAAE